MLWRQIVKEELQKLIGSSSVGRTLVSHLEVGSSSLSTYVGIFFVYVGITSPRIELVVGLGSHSDGGPIDGLIYLVGRVVRLVVLWTLTQLTYSVPLFVLCKT